MYLSTGVYVPCLSVRISIGVDNIHVPASLQMSIC